MAKPLLYQPVQRWRIAAALGGAVLIHFAAVALANIHPNTQTKDILPGQDDFPPLEIIDPFSPANESTPPPDVPETPPSQVPDTSMFPEERSTPPPVRRQVPTRAVPIAKIRSNTIGSLSLSSARISALSAPRPEYPYEARRQKVTGNGIVAMTVDSADGSVTNVTMEASTGSAVLDNAAVTAFRRWRFKPGTVSHVRSPITFTMTGAQY